MHGKTARAAVHPSADYPGIWFLMTTGTMQAFEGNDELPPDCNAEIRTIVDYWRSIHPESGLPGRQHFDPIDIPKLLPSIRLIDVVGDPPRFRTRLMGTKMAASVGRDYTGMWMDETFKEFRSSSAYLGLNTVVRSGKLNWRRGHPAIMHGKEFMVIERVYLPFARDGKTVDMILTYVMLGDSDGKMY